MLLVVPNCVALFRWLETSGSGLNLPSVSCRLQRRHRLNLAVDARGSPQSTGRYLIEAQASLSALGSTTPA
jgi:hypothetical protein